MDLMIRVNADGYHTRCGESHKSCLHGKTIVAIYLKADKDDPFSDTVGSIWFTESNLPALREVVAALEPKPKPKPVAQPDSWGEQEDQYDQIDQ